MKNSREILIQDLKDNKFEFEILTNLKYKTDNIYIQKKNNINISQNERVELLFYFDLFDNKFYQFYWSDYYNDFMELVEYHPIYKKYLILNKIFDKYLENIKINQLD